MSNTYAKSKKQEREWAQEARKIGAHHMIVALDLVEDEKYAVFVAGVSSAMERAQQMADMPTVAVLEVYNLEAPLAPQLDEQVAWNF